MKITITPLKGMMLAIGIAVYSCLPSFAQTSTGASFSSVRLNKEGTISSKYLSVSNESPGATGNEYRIPGTIAHFDGRVYISEVGGTEKGFLNTAGTNYKDFLLWVEEGIVTPNVQTANITEWPDYVFGEDYNLPTLIEVEKSIKANGHLPTMPSAAHVEKNGFTLVDITKRTVTTLEELTLHAIGQEKKINRQVEQINAQNELIKQMMTRLKALESK